MKQGNESVAASATSNSSVKNTNKKSTKYGRGLSASQLKELEKKLRGLRTELKTAIEGKTNTVMNVATASESLIKGDDAEVAEKQRMSNAALQELDILKGRLGLVERALAKMNAGVYGLCEESEEAIGFDRLIAVPWARYAVHVQEVRERKLRDFKVSRLRAEV